MKISLCQMNSHLGHFELNFKKITDAVSRAHQDGADVLVFPEMSLLGYPPQDLLERQELLNTSDSYLKKIKEILSPRLVVILGSITRAEKNLSRPYLNSAIVLEKRKKSIVISKKCLPQYDIFDETRFFSPGSQQSNVIDIKGKKVHISICEDMWSTIENEPKFDYKNSPFKNLKKIDLFINLSASPYVRQKINRRHKIAQNISQTKGAPFIYVTSVGAQDEIIFDGGSFVITENKIHSQLGQFQEEFLTVELDLNSKKMSRKSGQSESKKPLKLSSENRLSPAQELCEAVSLGLKDYVAKCGFKKVHLGMSGGIDSAVVAALAVKSLGSENVTGLALPGPFSDQKSLDFAQKQADKLNIHFLNLPIVNGYELIAKELSNAFEVNKFGLLHENLQSRLRGMFLMAYANSLMSLLLTTGNKSEYATGYATLYGDMNGGIAPLGDCLKNEVYELAEELNRQGFYIPLEVIKREPSAELRPNQKDSDSLPPYSELDKAVKNIVELQLPVQNQVEEWLFKTLVKTEFKRWQAAPILRISQHAFGRGRRWPLAHAFFEK